MLVNAYVEKSLICKEKDRTVKVYEYVRVLSDFGLTIVYYCQPHNTRCKRNESLEGSVGQRSHQLTNQSIGQSG